MKTTTLTKTAITLLILLIMIVLPVSAATQQITNGGFENGWSGWTTQSDGAIVGIQSTGIDPSASGDYAYILASAEFDQTNSGSFSQTVNLAGVQSITFRAKLFDYSGVYGPTRLTVLLGGTTIASYNAYQIPASWGSLSIDVSDYNDIYTLTFRVSMTSGDITVGIDDISAIAYTTPPTVTQVSTGSTATLTGQPTTATITYTAGDVTPATFLVNWGDGTGVTSYTSSSSPFSIQHTYQNPGTYTVTARGALLIGNLEYTTDPVTTQATVISADFTATPTSGPAPLTVTYTADVSNANTLLWNFGDGGTSTLAQTQHTYTQNNVYTVSLTATASNGQSVTITKENLITVADEYVRWNQISYTEGDEAIISWALINPDFSTRTYQLRIYAADAGGYPTGDPVRTPVDINTATGQTTIDTTNLAGNYIAVIAINGVNSDIYASTSIVSVATLTVNIALDAVVYTDETTVSVLKDGTIVQTTTTTSGQAQFTLPTGTYTVTATTLGYNQQTATITLTQDASITMDFIRGSSETTGGGSGIAYASTFITFRVLDELTGVPVSGATVYAVGKTATNPISWMSQLFGGSWGENILETELSGTTDSDGVITFAMFPNIRYEVTVSYQDITHTEAFQPSALSGEYLIRLEVTKIPSQTADRTILTNVSAENGVITATYNDTTKSTTQISFVIEQQQPNGNYTVVESRNVIAQSISQQFVLEDYSGESYRITISANTTAYGPVTRSYATTFPGPLVDIGLPDGLYIYLVLGVLLLFAAVGTVVTSPMIAVCVCFMGWLFYFLGWMFALGSIAPVALVLATVLSILFYIRSRSPGGGYI